MDLIGCNSGIFRAPGFIVSLVGNGERREKRRREERKREIEKKWKEGRKNEFKKVRGKIRRRNFNKN